MKSNKQIILANLIDTIDLIKKLKHHETIREFIKIVWKWYHRYKTL